jgi:hypothetical protein
MGKFATGKHSYAISDRSGQRYRYQDMRREWNGLLVGKDEYEPKQPQLEPFPKVFDPQALQNARPDRTEPEVEQLLNINPFQSGVLGSSILTVTEPSHGRTNGSTVCFRTVTGFDGFTKSAIEDSSGYVITVVSADTYTFTIPTETATVGTTRGGGSNATAGPVTLVN